MFACKASRYITHIKKLKDPEETTPKFFDAISHLGSRCGPVLFQLPPNWRPNPQRLEEFLAALPKDYRYVFEFRDADWHTEAVYETLRDANVGLVIADIGGETSPLVTTSDTVYIRLHGPEAEAYRGSYSDRAIDAWADRIREWRQRGDTVYCFFDNDEAGYAPSDALRLMHRLSG